MRLVRSSRRWSFVTVEAVDQLERVAVLNAQLERELAAILLGPFASQRARLVAALGTTAALLTCWNVFTLARAFLG